MSLKTSRFSEAEYHRRHRLVREAMDARGFDLLFVTDPSNMNWLTGYDGWSFYVHQGVIFPKSGDPFWWGRLQDSNGALRTVYMPDENVLGYAERYVQSLDIHPMQDLAEHLKDMGFEKAKIGVELDNYYYSARAHLTLTHKMPHADFEDAQGLVNWQRTVKSEEELDYIRTAAKISDKIVSLALEEAEIGMRKNDLVSKIYATAIAGLGQAWGDYPAIVPLMPSGEDASAPHLTWDGEPFRADEATFFELSGCYMRYHAPLCRTLYFGKPPEYLSEAAKALAEGLEAGLEAAMAGNRACDVADALENIMSIYGIDRKGARCGYPVGVSYPPDWGERTISFRSDDQSILEPGMVFHFMPGLWMDGWGMEMTETILIRASGPAKALGRVERKLFVKD